MGQLLPTVLVENRKTNLVIVECLYLSRGGGGSDNDSLGVFIEGYVDLHLLLDSCIGIVPHIQSTIQSSLLVVEPQDTVVGFRVDAV